VTRTPGTSGPVRRTARRPGAGPCGTAGALRDAAIRYNRAYFKLRLPARLSAGNVIIGVKAG
jgi:hypothetical protein